MWYGEYNHTIDEKDRFILPAKFRDKIKNFDSKKFFLTKGLDGCLFMYHQDVWQGQEEKLKNLSFTKAQSRAFNRMYFGGAQEIDIDAQGRISLPDYLKSHAAIDRDIIIIGVSDRIEIWSKKRWEEFYKNNEGKFEETAENLFE